MEDGPDLAIAGGFAYVMLQARGSWKWVNDPVTLLFALLVAGYMVVFNHTSDWRGHGDFFAVTPTFLALLGRHLGVVLGALWAAEKGGLAASGGPMWLQQVFPKFNARTGNGGTTPPAATQGGK